MSSYFNAWLDNRNLYTGPKRFVTAFAARLSTDLENVERFFAAYPEGRLISIVREPRSWYASARRHHPDYHDPDEAIGLWRRSADAAVVAAGRFEERVILLTYENLVLDTEQTMRRVAAALGLTMSPTLVEPTFNGFPIRANSSEPVSRYGVIAERASAYRDSLDEETIGRIEQLAGDAYGRAAEVAQSDARRQAIGEPEVR